MSTEPEHASENLATTYHHTRKSLESSIASQQVLSFHFASHMESIGQRLDEESKKLRASVADYFENHPEAADAYAEDVRSGTPVWEEKYASIKPQLAGLAACTHLHEVLANHLPEFQKFEEQAQGLRLDLDPELTPNSGLAAHISKNRKLLSEQQECINSFLAHVQSYPPCLPFAETYIKKCETFSLNLLQYELDNAQYYGQLREFNSPKSSLEHKQKDTLQNLKRLHKLSSETIEAATALEITIKKAFLQEEHASEDILNAQDSSYMAESFKHAEDMLEYLEIRTEEASTNEEISFIGKTIQALVRNNCFMNEMTWQQLQGDEETPGIIPQLLEKSGSENPYIDDLLHLARSDGPLKTLIRDSNAFQNELNAKQRQTQI